MRLRRLLSTPELIAGVTSGLLFTLASPPSPLGVLGFVALAPLLLVLFSPERVRSGEPVRLRAMILSFGLTHHITTLYWLVLLGDAATFRYRWLLPICLLLLTLYLTIFDALPLWIARRLRNRYGAQAIFWFPGLWVCGEWLMAKGELGFPWLRLATTQWRFVPLLQVAGLLGELGVTFVVAWVNVLAVVIWLSWRGEYPTLGRATLHRYWGIVSLLVLLGGASLYGVITMHALERADPQTTGLRVAVIQGNVDLNDKWDPAKRDSTFVPFTLLTERAAREGARLVVWPETTIPFDLLRMPAYLQQVQELARRTGTWLLIGLPQREVTKEGQLLAFNSSLLMDDTGAVRGHYHKIHLLPLGERMPFQRWIPALAKWDMGQAEWAVGPEMTVFDVEGDRFSNLICFESIFPPLSRLAVQRGAGFLVNMSNDGWFGRTLAPYQHALMAAMRAAENRVPLVRVANNGISFFALPSGRIVDRTRLFERTIAVRTITPAAAGSPYTRHGDGPLFVLIAVNFAFLLAVGRRPG
jgi:apolipoprotein N-acyltransferase